MWGIPLGWAGLGSGLVPGHRLQYGIADVLGCYATTCVFVHREEQNWGAMLQHVGKYSFSVLFSIADVFLNYGQLGMALACFWEEQVSLSGGATSLST